MTYYRLNYKTATKEIRLESGAGAAPALIAGWTDGGTFQHDAVADTLGDNPATTTKRLEENHVLFHHVQKWADLAFGVKDKKVYDLSKWVIKTDVLRSLDIGAGGIAVAANADSADITATPTPANASLEGLVWASSVPAKATLKVGTNKLTQRKVHGVAAGTSNLTASLAGVTSNTRVITVS